MKIILNILPIIGFCVGAIRPVVYWAMNPEITQMQMVLAFWPFYILAIVCALLMQRWM